MKDFVRFMISGLILLLLIPWPVFAEDSSDRYADTAKKSPAGAWKKAQQLARKGEYHRALELLEPFAGPTAENSALYSDYIVFHFWAGNTKKAIALFESMPETLSRRPYLIRNMAKAYYDHHDFQKAEQYYRQTVEADPTDRIAKEGLIASLFQQKQYTESLERFHALAGSDKMQQARIETLRESLITSLSPEEKDSIAAELKTAADTGALHAVADYLLVLILQRQYNRALQYLEASSVPADQLPDPYLYWVAWACFQEKKLSRSETLFHELIRRNPAYERGFTGLAHVYAAQGRNDLALSELTGLQSRLQGDSLELRYAFAYVYEQSGRFLEAVAVYDSILADDPANRTAAKLRLNALSDLGAATDALHQAKEALPEEKSLVRSIQARRAVHYIQWKEPEKAIRLLSAELAKDPGSGLRFEYIVALADAGRYAEVLPVYEELEAEGGMIPAWVMERAASAYLAEHFPEKALAIYEKALSLKPDFREARMGKVYALQDLREWRAAEKELADMETDTKPFIGGQHREFNPDLMEIHIARGWLLAGEGRLREADETFASLRKTAPASLDIRNGQAHVFSWRGWKRKSLEEFHIIESMDPEYLSVQPGKIAVLDVLAHKEDARQRLSEKMNQYPRDRRFRNVDRSFQIDGMHELAAEMELQWENDGTRDFFLQTTESTPLSLYTRLHAFQLWRRTWNSDLTEAQKAAGEDEPAYFRRAGLGLDHIFNSTWSMRQQFSFDYVEGGDFGSYTRLRITPDDHWRVDAIVDTFTIDVPARARIQDVTAVKTAIDTVYRESEWREYGLLIGRQWFSDGNDRDEILAGVSQYLYVKNDWKMRLSGHVYYGMNSEYDDPAVIYFNPKSGWGLSVTHMTEQVVWQRYERFFIHRLFLSAGNYKQNGYGNAFTGLIRYEQDHAFTDTHHLMGAVRFGRNVYDGDPVNHGAFELMFQWRF
ncbi:MAG: hypothetical protein C4522_05475 [Desulfobacteraceae bacterium]|nr:MAG: hypothetical protein C4522_05475 [Desulfobacteraceae bacterium]